jgi:hypothetical protein
MYGFQSRTLLGHHVVHVAATEFNGQVTHTTFTVGMRHFGIRVSTVAAGEFWNDVKVTRLI